MEMPSLAACQSCPVYFSCEKNHADEAVGLGCWVCGRSVVGPPDHDPDVRVVPPPPVCGRSVVGPPDHDPDVRVVPPPVCGRSVVGPPDHDPDVRVVPPPRVRSFLGVSSVQDPGGVVLWAAIVSVLLSHSGALSGA